MSEYASGRSYGESDVRIHLDSMLPWIPSPSSPTSPPPRTSLYSQPPPPKNEIPIPLPPPPPPSPPHPRRPHLQLGRPSLHLALLVQLPAPRQRPLPLPYRQAPRDPRFANHPHAARRHGLQPTQRLPRHRLQ